MKIVTTDDLEENTRYYTFKPYVTFQDDTTDLIALNSVHIVSESTPSEVVMTHYASALADADKFNKIRKSTSVSLSEVQAKLKELTEEEMDEFLALKLSEIEETELDKSDSQMSNIIKFKPRGTYH